MEGNGTANRSNTKGEGLRELRQRFGVIEAVNAVSSDPSEPGEMQFRRSNWGSKQKRVTVYGRAQAFPVSTSSGRGLYSP